MSLPARPPSADLMAAGLRALQRHEEEINALNVFPVPDGDTGTNLVMTVQAVCDQLAQAGGGSLSEQLNAITLGSLMGARGNSGVILSQIIRGICDGLSQAEAVDARVVADALQNGCRVAYQAIRKPVEGTMLTVIRDAADAATERASAKSVEGIVNHVLEAALREAGASVSRTPDLLPVLKEAGVVDAGGFGLVVLGDAIVASLLGRLEEATDLVGATGTAVIEPEVDLDYRFCTELVVRSAGLDAERAENFLTGIGGSVMVASSGQVARIHVHTNTPWSVIEWAASRGSLDKVKVDDMVAQVKERAAAGGVAKAQGGVGVVAVANGGGIEAILRSLGVSAVVNGGQTMNPSAAELRDAVDSLAQRDVILLPNNPNIVLTAQQVKQLTTKQVAVVATRSIPEAFAALLALDVSVSLGENAEAMDAATKAVKTGEITHAVRGGRSGAVKFKKADLIGISDGKIRVAGRKLETTAARLVAEMVDGEDSAITLIFGDGVESGEAERIVEKVAKKHPRLDLDVQHGGQPLYPLIIGVE